MVNQESCQIEYLLVDGQSEDRTVEIIKDYAQRADDGQYASVSPGDFRWVSEPDTGLYDAMNKGIKMATGDFLWFMNAGDKIHSLQTTAKIEEVLNADSDVDIVYGQTLIIDEFDEILGERHKIAPPRLEKRDLLRGLVVGHQSILVRRSIAPLYDLCYTIASDYDWTVKVLARSRKNYYIDDYLSRFMVAGLSSVHRKRAWYERFLSMKHHFGCLPCLWAHLLLGAKYPFTQKY